MRATVACGWVLAWGCSAGCAAHPPRPPAGEPPVVRFADRGGLFAGEVRAAVAALGPVPRAALAERPMFDAFLRDLATLHLLARQAEQELPPDDPILALPLGVQRDRLLAVARIDAEVARRGPIPEAELRRFYETHPEYFQKVARVRFRQIVADRRDRAEAAARLAAGEPFDAVARRYSVHPSAARGGEMGWHEEGRLEPALRKVIATLAPGVASPVVESRFGCHIVEVEERRPTTPMPFASVRDRVARRLDRQRRQEVIQALIVALERDHPIVIQRDAADRLFRELAATAPSLLHP